MARRSKDRKARGRPLVATLSRERLLGAGLVLLDQEGFERFTMRRLAEHLGVSPMALYNHVSCKQDLLRGMAEQLVSGIAFDSDDPDWRERIRICFRRLRRTCLDHPGAVRLMENLDAAPPAVFSPLEVTLAALAATGIARSDALRAFYLLMNFTMGQLSYEVRGPFPALDPAEALRRGHLPGTGFDHVRESVPLGAWNFDRAFEFGLTTIIAGLEQIGRAYQDPDNR